MIKCNKCNQIMRGFLPAMCTCGGAYQNLNRTEARKEMFKAYEVIGIFVEELNDIPLDLDKRPSTSDAPKEEKSEKSDTKGDPGKEVEK